MRKQYFTAHPRNFTLRQQDFIARKRASPYLLLLFPRQRLRHEGCCSMGGIGLGAAAGCSLRTYGRGTNGSAFASGGVKRRFARSSRARPTSLFGSVSPSSALLCTGAGRYCSCGEVGSAGHIGGDEPTPAQGGHDRLHFNRLTRPDHWTYRRQDDFSSHPYYMQSALKMQAFLKGTVHEKTARQPESDEADPLPV